MKFALLHLSGPQRGKTQYFDSALVSLGSAASNDVVLPDGSKQAVAPLHVKLYEADCQMHLRHVAPHVKTFINSKPVTETILQDQDLLQLGKTGPKLRFRIRPEEYAACKRVREILQDSLDLATQAKGEGRAAVSAFLGQLTYDVQVHATRTTKAVVISFIALTISVLAGVGYYAYTTRQAYERELASLLEELKSVRLTQADLERRIAEERQRLGDAFTTRRAEIERVTATLKELQQRGASQDEVHALMHRLKLLETEHTGADRWIVRYGPSVCFLYGAYRYVPQGKPDVIIPPTELEFMGSGFLADPKGLIVTNRHLMQPWTTDRSSAELIQAGAAPELIKLLAYFPGQPQPYKVSVVGVSDRGDIALAQLSSVPRDIPAIPIRKPSPQGRVGDSMVVLGYPVGVEGLLARMDSDVVEALVKRSGENLGQLIQGIADHDGIRPLANQGHIGDIVPGSVVYDAPTTTGVSGSPVFNSQGDVIAVHSAMMIRFGGASYGVPIDYIFSLLQ